MTAVRATEDPVFQSGCASGRASGTTALVLSTSAAVYRSSRRAARLPLGMWGGICLVWLYWLGSQSGIF